VNNGPVDPDDLSALSPWAGELAKTFVSLASDIALVVDASGVITSVEQSRTEPMAPGASRWVGRPWVDTVSGETRRKIELLLHEVSTTGSGRRREVNHLALGGVGIPVAYTAIRLGATGPVLAVGRDLRSIAAIQQRFLTNQQDLERGYWRVREAETRERRLHQVATDTMFLVDAPTLSILHAGALPGELFAQLPEPPQGKPLAELFDAHSRGPLDELLVTARGMGRPVEIRARLGGSHASVSVAATPFRAGDTQRLLVRVRGIAETAVAARELVIISDSSGRLVSCTPRVVDFAGASGETALHGRPVGEVIGAVPEAFAALLAGVRRDGLASTSMLLRNAAGRHGPVHLAAMLLTEGDQENIGFVLTPTMPSAPDVESEPVPAALSAADAVLDTLVARLGQTPLRALLDEAAAVAERHLIGAALRRSGGDERAAAALLGLSPETLRRRLRRIKAQDASQTARSGADT